MSSQAAPAAERVPCRRLQQPRSVTEHRRCPYCFGKRDDVRSGDHGRFCDFEQGVDPLIFGFPPEVGRLARR